MTLINEQLFPTCQHIHLKGVRCGSPALKGHPHCYFHNRVRRLHRGVVIPLLEDATAIQVAITEVMRALGDRDLDHRTAALLLYGLQVAAQNLPRMNKPYGPMMVTEDPAEPRFAAATEQLDPKASSAQIMAAYEQACDSADTIIPFSPRPDENDDDEEDDDEAGAPSPGARSIPNDSAVFTASARALTASPPRKKSLDMSADAEPRSLDSRRKPAAARSG